MRMFCITAGPAKMIHYSIDSERNKETEHVSHVSKAT